MSSLTGALRLWSEVQEEVAHRLVIWDEMGLKVWVAAAAAAAAER